MLSVYIETTIPSYYHETRTAPIVIAWRDATREWWDRQRHAYELRTSRFVLAELGRSPAVKAARCLAMMRNTRLLKELPEVRIVAEFYIEQKAMPLDAAGDAYHLAMASIHRVDFLLTWNCLHLANARKQRHLTVLNGRLGLPMPIITTPLTLLPEDGE